MPYSQISFGNTMIHIISRKNKKFTCIVAENGDFRVDAMVTYPPIENTENTESTPDLVRDLMLCPGIKTIKPSMFLQEELIQLWRYKHAVRLIEKAILSPHTVLGRQRLEREFFTLTIEA